MSGETFTAKSTDYALFGTYSLKLATGVSGTKNFYYESADLTLSNNTQYTISCYIRESTGAVVALTHGFADGAAGNVVATSRYLGNGWYLFHCTLTTGTVTNSKVGFVGVDYSKTYYIHMQLEAKDDYTTFCQGGLNGCIWNGTDGESTSTRNAYEHTGGRWKSLYTDYDITPDVGIYGLGMPPREILTTSPSGADGSQPNGKVINIKERIINFKSYINSEGQTIQDFHDTRRAFIQAMNHRYTRPGEQPKPRILEYRGTTEPRQIEVFWEAGMEFDNPDGQNFTVEDLVLKFKCPKPFWTGFGSNSVLLDNEVTKTSNLVAGRINGSWSAFTPPTTITSEVAVYELLYSAITGKLYIAGDFTDLESTFADYLAIYTPSTDAFNALNTSPTYPASALRALHIGYKNNLYLADSSNVKQISIKSPTSFTNIGTVTGGVIYDMASDNQTGDLYIVGSFTGINGVANTSKIAKYDFSAATWVSVSTASGAPNATLTHIAITSDDLIHVAGAGLTLINGVTVSGVARKSVTDTTWYSLSDARVTDPVAMTVHDSVLYVADSTDLKIYAMSLPSMASTGNTGNFNSRPFNTIATYVGDCTRLKHTRGTLFACGARNFYVTGLGYYAGGEGVLAYDGTKWYRPFSDFYTDQTVYDIEFDNRGGVYFGMSSGTSYYGAGLATINYPGSAEAYPTITIEHLGATDTVRVLTHLGNVTTGSSVPLYYQIFPNEIVTLAFEPGGLRAFSSTKGDVANQFDGLRDMKILAGTDSTTTTTNQISLMILEVALGRTADISASVTWQDLYWSFD
jgi:hypothetical protein